VVFSHIWYFGVSCAWGDVTTLCGHHLTFRLRQVDRFSGRSQ
jgi:hypothetical protein